MPEAFSDGPQCVEVRLDGRLLGASELWWDDAAPAAQVVAELREWLSGFLDEESPDGWW